MDEAIECGADSSVAEKSAEALRSRDIRVTIDLDVEKNLDRAIELINGTDELNFTKARLKKKPQKARKKLQKILAGINTQAGLVRLADRCGDYGYCGFYLARTKHDRTHLVQFCFSSGIRNMGVEHWLYERLGRPGIEICGAVLSDLSKPMNVDWVRLENGAPKSAGGPRRAFICGRCSVAGLVHYFRMDSYDVVAEFEEARDSIVIRRDHTLMLRHAIEGVPAAQMAIFRELGFTESDFVTKFHDTTIEPSVRILGNWGDSQAMIWRHKESGLLVPFKLKRAKTGKEGKPEAADIPEAARRAQAYLREHFKFVGRLPEVDAARNFDVILDALPKGSPLFVIAAPEKQPEEEDAPPAGAGVELNRRTMAAAARHPQKLVLPLSVADLADEDERHSIRHFHRKVYYRLYREICAKLEALNAPPSDVVSSTMNSMPASL